MSEEKPMSALKKERLAKKMKKQKIKEEVSSPAYWDEVHNLVDILHGMLSSYGEINVNAENLLLLISEEDRNNVLLKIKTVYQDITLFANNLKVLKANLGPIGEVIKANNYPLFLESYETLDGLQTDITNTVGPICEELTNIILNLNVKEETHESV